MEAGKYTIDMRPVRITTIFFIILTFSRREMEYTCFPDTGNG